jgi:ankyrin repeat protein
MVTNTTYSDTEAHGSARVHNGHNFYTYLPNSHPADSTIAHSPEGHGTRTRPRYQPEDAAREVARGMTENLRIPEEQGRTILGAAIADCDHQTIAKLLQQGVTMICNNKNDKRCLRLAIEVGDEAIVQSLITAGATADPTLGDLHLAASLGHDKVVQRLLNCPEYGERWHLDCTNALHEASKRGRLDILTHLLDKADALKRSTYQNESMRLQTGVNFEDIYTDALWEASAEGHIGIIQVLLAQGTKVDACWRQGGTALHEASRKGHLESVRALLRGGADVSAKSGLSGDDALQIASFHGRAEIVEELLRHGANAKTKGGRYGSAIQAASSNGHNRIVQILIQSGANVNDGGGRYANVLQAASSEGHPEVVSTLLAHGADVNAESGYYGNALQVASVNGHVKVVRELIYWGAKVNAKGGYYGNALQAAASHGHDELVNILIQAGADVSAKGGQHGSALVAALRSGHDEIAFVLGNR